jgi:hypothetical protein
MWKPLAGLIQPKLAAGLVQLRNRKKSTRRAGAVSLASEPRFSLSELLVASVPRFFGPAGYFAANKPHGSPADGHIWLAMLVEYACMGIANGQVAALAAGTVLLFTVSLGGCATSTAGSSPMDARAEAPAPPKTSVYPPIFLPPKRERPATTADEQLKLQKELIAARDRQAASVKAQGAAQAKPAE